MTTPELVKRYQHLAQADTYDFGDQLWNEEEMHKISCEIRMNRGETL
jgi:hypothetical protein